MKKFITSTFIVALAGLAFAAEQNYFVGNYTWTSKANFEADISSKYNGATGGTITFNLPSEQDAVNFTSDFTFESIVAFTGATTRIKSEAGTTLTFNTVDIKNGAKFALFTGGTTIFKSGDFSGTNDIYLQSPVQTTLILDGASLKNGHTHFYNGVKILAKKDAQINLLYFRASNVKNSFERTVGGTVAAAGCTLTVGDMARNPGNGFLNADFYFEFASEGADEIIYKNTDLYTEIMTGAQSQLILKDFGFGDTLQVKESLTDAKFTDKLFVETGADDSLVRKTFAELFNAGMIKEDTTTNAGFYTYTVIPEPAEYAVIFGVLALGLVFYRRRK